MSKVFPEGFYWGAALASYQVEGGIDNCDWAKAGRDGKVPEAGNACDHFSRYKEDFDLAKNWATTQLGSLLNGLGLSQRRESLMRRLLNIIKMFFWILSLKT